jgi:probable rRNA maturation factor
MSLALEVTISDELQSESAESAESDLSGLVPEPELLQVWADAAYLNTEPAVASVLVTTMAEIQALNKQYRNKDKATNVLSFPMQSPEEIDIILLGDIVLCAVIIKQEANQQSKSEEAHWAHMVVHSVLHLQGYDHMNDDDAEIMEKLEIKILHQLGFEDPY